MQSNSNGFILHTKLNMLATKLTQWNIQLQNDKSIGHDHCQICLV
jgi:hypothetical protein